MNAFPSPGLPGILPEVSLSITFLAGAALLTALLAVAAPSFAAKPAKSAKSDYVGALTIMYGDNHAFGIIPPEGWAVDDSSGINSKIRVVLYPIGQKWDSAPTVMYVNPLHGYGAKARTVSALIAEDEKSFRQRTPRGKVTEGGTIQTTGKKTAVVRYFSSDGGPAHEAVAYVPEAEMVMLLVLSSKTPEGFQGALAAYREMVQSYAWVASNAEMGR